MWNAPQRSATSASLASASVQSTSTASSAPYCARPLRHRADVRLVVLAEVGREGVRDRAVLAHPRERAARVEAARERDPDALADGQRAEDDARACRRLARTLTRARPRCSAGRARASSAPVMPSRAATKIVLSPAIVPATSARFGAVDRLGERGREPRRRADDEQPVRRRHLARPAPQRARELVQPANVGGARERVDEPAVRVAHLDQPELRDVARDRRLDGVDARARAARRRAPPGSRAAAAARAAGSPPAARTSSSRRAPPRGSRAPGRPPPSVIVSGGVSRSASRPRCRRAGRARAPRRRPARRAVRARAARSSPRPRHAAERARSSCDTFARTCASSSSSTRVDDRAGGGARDRVAAERGGVVAGLERRRRVVGDEQRADRQPVREPLRERHRVGPDAELLPREERAGAADAGLHLVEDEQRAVLVGERAREREDLRRERPDAALALHRLEQDRGRRRRRRRRRRGVVRASRSARPGRAARTARASPAAPSPRARPSCGRGTSRRARRARCGRSPCART